VLGFITTGDCEKVCSLEFILDFDDTPQGRSIEFGFPKIIVGV